MSSNFRRLCTGATNDWLLAHLYCDAHRILVSGTEAQVLTHEEREDLLAYTLIILHELASRLGVPAEHMSR